MLPLTLSLANNPVGSNPLSNLYAEIAAQYPALGLTPENSNIHLLNKHSGQYQLDRTRLEVRLNNDPTQEHIFTYDRFNIVRYVNNPLFTEVELPAVQAMDSKQLLAHLATKLNLNLTEDDFFVDTAGITYTGGTAKPNWRLKSRFDSIYWHGEKVVYLHL